MQIIDLAAEGFEDPRRVRRLLVLAVLQPAHQLAQVAVLPEQGNQCGDPQTETNLADQQPDDQGNRRHTKEAPKVL